MLPIRVNGKGLIPRGYGIAPRKEPFKADLNLIALIISTPGLTPVFVDPNTKQTTTLTRKNYRNVYMAYEKKLEAAKLNKDIEKPAVAPPKNNEPKNNAPVDTPAPPPVQEPPKVEPKPEVKPDNKVEVKTNDTPPVEEKSEDKKDEDFTIKPFVKKDDDNKNNKDKK